MNREIKFRAYVPSTGKMIDLYKTTPLALDANLEQDGLFIPFSVKYLLMQFTGLKDKMQVKIYEGDIVKCHDHPTGMLDHTGVVVFKGGMFTTDKHSDIPIGDYGSAWIEIIGNIHQTPELCN